MRTGRSSTLPTQALFENPDSLFSWDSRIRAADVAATITRHGYALKGSHSDFRVSSRASAKVVFRVSSLRTQRRSPTWVIHGVVLDFRLALCTTSRRKRTVISCGEKEREKTLPSRSYSAGERKQTWISVGRIFYRRGTMLMERVCDWYTVARGSVCTCASRARSCMCAPVNE